MNVTRKFEDILYEIDPPLALITINRPGVRNACRVHTMREIAEAVAGAGADGRVRAVIVTGAGDKAFSAGADLKESRGGEPGQHERQLIDAWYEALRQIESLGKPVIAAVRGWAVGGGTELVMACHLRIAGRSARFGQPEILRGHIPGGGGTVRLPRLIGQGRALYYLLTGADIPAVDALAIGLVTKVVEDDQVLEEARRLGRRLAELSSVAIELTLRSVIGGRDASVESALALERALCGEMRQTRDYAEGLEAFVEKRLPRYNVEPVEGR